MSLAGSVADVLANRAQWGMAFGCSRQVMRSSLPAECVHVVCTSPPYWGLRAYSPEARPEEIGREKTPAEYVDTMADVGRAVRHVLRQDGVWILNLGDTYASSAKGTGGVGKSGLDSTPNDGNGQLFGAHRVECDVTEKNLLLIPSRVALALQADGWIVRSAVPWIKLSCMPESVTDRLTVAHETVFVLVRSKRYFWDADAVRVGWADDRCGAPGGRPGTRVNIGGRTDGYTLAPLDWKAPEGRAGRNLRTSDIWLAGLDSLEEQLEAYLAHVRALRERKGMLTEPDGSLAGLLVNPVPYTGAHFAAYPPRLIAPLIRAATSERGCCPHCGAQWVRAVERNYTTLKNDASLDARKRACGETMQGGLRTPGCINSVSRAEMTAASPLLRLSRARAHSGRRPRPIRRLRHDKPSRPCARTALDPDRPLREARAADPGAHGHRA